MDEWGRRAEMSMPSEMACKELVELVTEYLEGTLSPFDRKRFEDHLKDCDPCTTYLEQMRQTIRALGRVTEEDLSEAAKQDLLRIFRDWKREPPSR
jgi:anti-sigma factor RsiW